MADKKGDQEMRRNHHIWQLLGQRLRQARRDAGMTQMQVAAILGKPQSYVSKIERARRRVDPIEFAELVAIYDKPAVYYLDFLLDLWEGIK
jgi:transcriptional regulator with XRE-family HTH domain